MVLHGLFYSVIITIVCVSGFSNCLHLERYFRKMALTIYDISKQAGVSIATVSRVLNGSDNVKASTREKVMKIINENDYSPNAFARGMGLHSMHTIGILCADSSDIFLAKAVYFLEQELQINGYESLLCCTGYNLDVKKQYLNLILSKKVDAVILVGSNFIGFSNADNAYIKEAADQVPVMLLNASLDYDNVYSTLCDDYETMYGATTALLESGIDKILYIYNSESYSGMKKKDGFCEAMNKASIKKYADLVHKFNGDIYDTAGVSDFIEKISSKAHFDAVITSEDALAIGALKYAYKNELQVPKDLSIIGYNNSLLSTCSTPTLTSIDNKLETQTHQLVRTLMGVLNGEEMPKRSIFSGALIKRETTMF